MKKRNSLKGLAVGTALAASIGYVAGVASANRSKMGKSTKTSLKEEQEKLKLIFSELGDLISNLSDNDDSNLSERARQRYETAITKGMLAKEEIGKYLEDRKLKFDNKELKLAIKEAEKAIHNLKEYLLKK